MNVVGVPPAFQHAFHAPSSGQFHVPAPPGQFHVPAPPGRHVAPAPPGRHVAAGQPSTAGPVAPGPGVVHAPEQISKDVLEGILGFRIVDFDKYVSVFTHKSFKESGRDSYERYEFVGDSVINFVIAKYLYDKFPQADEGFLTRVRTKLVSGKCLSDLSRRLGLHRYVMMNQKALRQGWNSNPRILEDVFESLVGCVYLDLGLATAKTFVLSVMERFVDFRDIVRDTNYKDILMRYAQANMLPLPEYRVLNDPQVTKTPLFDIVVMLQGVGYGRGADTCKKGAEQSAAQQALLALRVPLD